MRGGASLNLEGRDEGVWQVGDEAHSVAGQHLPAGGQVHLPQHGVQGLEQPVRERLSCLDEMRSLVGKQMQVSFGWRAGQTVC